MAVLIEQQDYLLGSVCMSAAFQVLGIPTAIGAKLADSCLAALLMTWLAAAGGSADRRVRGLP